MNDIDGDRIRIAVGCNGCVYDESELIKEENIPCTSSRSKSSG